MPYDVLEDDASFTYGPVYTGQDPDYQVVIDASDTIGTVTLNPDGTISYSPANQFESLAEGQRGADHYSYTIIADGTAVTYTVDLSIVGQNDAPIATGTLAAVAIDGGAAWSYTFPAGLFRDIDGDTLSYAAQLDTGAALPAWLSFDAATRTFSGTPPATFDGTIRIVLLASDGLASAGVDFEIDVTATAVEIAAGEDDTGLVTAPIYTGTDPAAQLSIDTTGTRGTATLNADGTITYAPGDAFQSLAEGATGQDGFTVTITADGRTRTVRYVVDVTGANDAPVAAMALPPQTLTGGSDFSYTVPTGAFSDVDGDALAYTARLASGDPLPDWLHFDAATRTFSGTTPFFYSGTLDVVVLASDGRAVASDGISFHVNPDATVLGVEEDGPAVTSGPVYAGSDPNATLALDTAGTAGSVALNADGTVTYDPHGAFEALAQGVTGHDGFDVLVTEFGVTTRHHYVVDIAGENDAPVATGGPIGDQAASGGTAFSYALPAGYFTDADGTPTLSATLASGAPLPMWLTFDPATGAFAGTPPETFGGTLAIVVTANDGMATATAGFSLAVTATATGVATSEDAAPVTIVPPTPAGATVSIDTRATTGLATLNPDGTISYAVNGRFEALAEGASGTDVFFVTTTLADGSSTTRKYLVTIAGENDPTLATVDALPTRYLSATDPVSFSLPADLFSDADGDPLRIVAYTAGGGLLPDWLVFDPATLSFTGTPPTGFSGKLDLRVQASDGRTIAKLPFSIIFSNAPHAVTAIPDQSFLEDTPFSFAVPAGSFIDPDGDPLTYTASLRNGMPLPDWLTFDAATQTFSGTPPQDYASYILVKVYASDGTDTVSSSFRLDITNTEDAPTAVSVTSPWIANQAAEGTIVGYLTTSDPDRLDRFTYKLIDDAGGHFKLDGDKLVVNVPTDSQSKGGVQTVTVRSTDAAGRFVDSRIAIQVQKTAELELFADKKPTHTVWVATTGSDATGDGSADHPFGTIQHALDNATPGVAIMVRAGTYAEALTLTSSGTADKPIWLTSADGPGAAIIKPVGVPEVNAIQGRGVSNIVIDGFAISGTNTRGTYGINLVSINNGAAGTYQYGYGGTKVANVVIKNNIITNWGIDGVHIAESVGVQVLRNTVSGAHEQGIDFVTATNVRIVGNTIDNITKMDAWKGLDTREYTGDAGISVKGGSQGVIVENNVIGTTGGFAIKLGDPTGLAYLPITDGADADGGHYVDYEVNGALVRGNTALGSAQGSVQINGAQNVRIDQNRITSILIKGYDRSNNIGLSGVIDPFQPGGASALSDDIVISRNVYTAAKLYNTFNGVTITDTGDNQAFAAGGTYDPASNAWVGGTTGGVTTRYDVINGKTATAANPGNDVLTGDRRGIANDYIDGKTGNDVMSGGYGDDVYVLDNKYDVVHEYQNAGTDTVIIGGSYALYNMATPVAGGDGWIENVIVNRDTFTTVNGNALDNEIVGGSATDRIRGADGNDTLQGMGGNDTLDGGQGDDKIYGGIGTDNLYGGDGNGVDVLDGGLGRDTMRGGGGNDVIVSVDADTLIDGGFGIDTAYLDRSTATQDFTVDISYFGRGDMASTDPRQIVLPDGTVLKNIEQVQIATGSGADTITGGYFNDDIASGDGADIVDGNDGNDRIWAGAGDDIVTGGAGADIIDGGPGLDTLSGGADNDTIYSLNTDAMVDGGTGFDTLIALRSTAVAAMTVDFSVLTSKTPGSVTLFDGTVIANFEQVTFTAGAGDDVITGTTGNDKINGAKGRDTIYGLDGADTIYGGADGDTIYGGAGADTLSGDGGADVLWGGSGVDTFAFKANQAEGDTIMDFEGAGKPGGDKLSFVGYGAGATLGYDASTQLWTVASADGSISDQFTILGVTTLIASDYTLL